MAIQPPLNSAQRTQDEYDSANRLPTLVRELIELWQYRDLLHLLVINGLKTRYKRSVLGVLWTLLNPLLSTLVLTVAFSQLFRFQIENYPVYLLAGLLAWTYFSNTVVQVINTMVWGSGLIKRIYLPRTVFAVAALGGGLIYLVISLLPLAAVMLAFQHPLRWSLLFVPVALLLLSMFTLGLALLLATIAVYFTDVADLTSIGLTAWFYLTPIIYPAEIFPENLRWILTLNPIVSLVECFRAPIFNGVLPEPTTLLVASVTAVVALVVGWVVYTSQADNLAYQL